ncbi:heavy-metal-associated domain-containing protein [Pedobacter sp.]|uniref:heavy-metal-associated domain-containing protein n=1 Tax=Pedobacter sp. TaxID=1411316 RepID=UPI003D7FF1A5
METLTFKTNIKCGGCVATVTPFLNAKKEISSWEVNTDSPDKTLTVAGDVSAEEVIKTLNEAGFQAEQR